MHHVHFLTFLYLEARNKYEDPNNSKSQKMDMVHSNSRAVE